MTPIRLAEGEYQTGKDEQKCISKPKEPSEVSKNNEEKLQLNKANRKISYRNTKNCPQIQKHIQRVQKQPNKTKGDFK